MRSSDKYCCKIFEIDHYKKHEQMQPFIGVNYEESGRLLILGESHYLEDNADQNVINNWYNINSSQLSSNDYDYRAPLKILDFA